MALKLSRRSFLKASAVATTSALMLGTGKALADDAAADADSQAGEDIQVIPSACRQCYGRCALFGTVKNGRHHHGRARQAGGGRGAVRRLRPVRERVPFGVVAGL